MSTLMTARLLGAKSGLPAMKASPARQSGKAATRSIVDVPRGQKRERESAKDCLRREIKEELPKLKLGRIRLWKKVNGTNRHSGRTMSDAIFIVNELSGDLTIGDQHQTRGQSAHSNVAQHQGHALPQAIASLWLLQLMHHQESYAAG
jgi:hypothetical protein